MESGSLAASRPGQAMGGSARGGWEHGLAGKWTSITCQGNLFPGVRDPGGSRHPFRASVSWSAEQEHK